LGDANVLRNPGVRVLPGGDGGSADAGGGFQGGAGAGVSGVELKHGLQFGDRLGVAATESEGGRKVGMEGRRPGFGLRRGGGRFFRGSRAKQLGGFRGLGYTGAYLGGVNSYREIEGLLDLERTFAPDDWRQFAREIRYSRPGEFFLFEEDPATGLSQAGVVNREWQASSQARESNPNVTPLYRLSKWVHHWMFQRGHGLAPAGARWCRSAKDPSQGPRVLGSFEKST